MKGMALLYDDGHFIGRSTDCNTIYGDHKRFFLKIIFIINNVK